MPCSAMRRGLWGIKSNIPGWMKGIHLRATNSVCEAHDACNNTFEPGGVRCFETNTQGSPMTARYNAFAETTRHPEQFTQRKTEKKE